MQSITKKKRIRKNEPDQRQSNLYQMRSRDDVSSGVSNRKPEKGICVSDVPERKDSREASSGPPISRQAYLDGRMKREEKKCDICGLKFKVGPTEKWKGRCGECAPKMRNSLTECPTCGRKFSLKNMILVSLQIAPGTEGSKKFKIRYCRECADKVRLRATKMLDAQKKDFDIAAAEQRENMKYLAG